MSSSRWILAGDDLHVGVGPMPSVVYVHVVSMFDMGDWVEVDVGILGDGSVEDYIVTDLQVATHRRYRNRVTGEVVVDRLRTL